jgi:hypothetical protein
MELEERPSSAKGWRKNSALNPTDSECQNENQVDELKVAMEIFDMELRADQIKWHKESEVSVEGREGFW